jgi:hypothetical protein
MSLFIYQIQSIKWVIMDAEYLATYMHVNIKVHWLHHHYSFL